MLLYKNNKQKWKAPVMSTTGRLELNSIFAAKLVTTFNILKILSQLQFRLGNFQFF